MLYNAYVQWTSCRRRFFALSSCARCGIWISDLPVSLPVVLSSIFLPSVWSQLGWLGRLWDVAWWRWRPSIFVLLVVGNFCREFLSYKDQSFASGTSRARWAVQGPGLDGRFCQAEYSSSYNEKVWKPQCPIRWKSPKDQGYVRNKGQVGAEQEEVHSKCSGNYWSNPSSNACFSCVIMDPCPYCTINNDLRGSVLRYCGCSKRF